MTKVVFWSTFPPFIECNKPQGTSDKGRQAFLTYTLQLIKAFFKTFEVVENIKFQKKATF